MLAAEQPSTSQPVASTQRATMSHTHHGEPVASTSGRQHRLPRYKVWNLQKRLAELSSQVEVAVIEARQLLAMKQEVPPLHTIELTPEDKQALEVNHKARLIEIVQKHCSSMLKGTMTHKWAFPFNTPVDTSRFADYLKVVQTPMDFSTIKTRVESGYYSDPKDFWSDMLLVFANARKYNPPGSDVYLMADTLEEASQERYDKMLAPRLAEEVAACQREEIMFKKRRAEQMNQSQSEAMDVQCASLLNLVSDLQAAIREAKSMAAAMCEPLSLEEKQALASTIQGLPTSQLEAIVAFVASRHPPSASSTATGRISLNLGKYDALLLRQMQHIAATCTAASKQAQAEAHKHAHTHNHGHGHAAVQGHSHAAPQGQAQQAPASVPGAETKPTTDPSAAPGVTAEQASKEPAAGPGDVHMADAAAPGGTGTADASVSAQGKDTSARASPAAEGATEATAAEPAHAAGAMDIDGGSKEAAFAGEKAAKAASHAGQADATASVPAPAAAHVPAQLVSTAAQPAPAPAPAGDQPQPAQVPSAAPAAAAGAVGAANTSPAAGNTRNIADVITNATASGVSARAGIKWPGIPIGSGIKPKARASLPVMSERTPSAAELLALTIGGGGGGGGGPGMLSIPGAKAGARRKASMMMSMSGAGGGPGLGGQGMMSLGSGGFDTPRGMSPGASMDLTGQDLQRAGSSGGLDGGMYGGGNEYDSMYNVQPQQQAPQSMDYDGPAGYGALQPPAAMYAAATQQQSQQQQQQAPASSVPVATAKRQRVGPVPAAPGAFGSMSAPAGTQPVAAAPAPAAPVAPAPAAAPAAAQAQAPAAAAGTEQAAPPTAPLAAAPQAPGLTLPPYTQAAAPSTGAVEPTAVSSQPPAPPAPPSNVAPGLNLATPPLPAENASAPAASMGMTASGLQPVLDLKAPTLALGPPSAGLSVMLGGGQGSSSADAAVASGGSGVMGMPSGASGTDSASGAAGAAVQQPPRPVTQVAPMVLDLSRTDSGKPTGPPIGDAGQ